MGVRNGLFCVWIVVLVRKLQLIVNERGWPSFPTSRSRSARMLKKLAIADGYQPRGSHLIKRKIDALFIIALLATSSSGTTRAHAQPDHRARCRPLRSGTATLWRAPQRGRQDHVRQLVTMACTPSNLSSRRRPPSP